MQPLSNLIATGQIRAADSIRVDFDPAIGCLVFYKGEDDLPAEVIDALPDPALPAAVAELSQSAVVELPRTARARYSRR